MLSLSSPDDRRKKLDPGPFRKMQDRIHHFIDRLPADLPAALRAVGDPDARVKKTQIIIDLRHRTDCGARVVIRGFLVDADGGRKSLNALHLRLFHLPEELTRIGA